MSSFLNLILAWTADADNRIYQMQKLSTTNCQIRLDNLNPDLVQILRLSFEFAYQPVRNLNLRSGMKGEKKGAEKGGKERT